MERSIKDRFVEHIENLQNEICEALETVDGKGKFIRDSWNRPGGGGGESRVIRDGNVFEKGGVNISVVHGKLPQVMIDKFGLGEGVEDFFACGLSLVIHPYNPHIPTVHANWRYFEVYNPDGSVADAWFGGGTDLTPYYLYDEDAVHFHKVQKESCDKYDAYFYPRFKEQCDNYFVNYHRDNERRGVGGVFYDYCRPAEGFSIEDWYNFVQNNGKAFTKAYIPIVTKHKDDSFSQEQKYWQEIRRGRYVEFNLIHDRGTLFGLKTNGRTESILMSLPPTVRFDYNHHPLEGSEEYKLIEVLMNPRDWVKTK